MTQPIHFCPALRGLPWLLAVLFASLPFGRVLACELELEGNPSPVWRQAVRSLPGSVAGDCASSVLRVQGDEARLSFVTQDGRRAERVLADPRELAPTIAALSEAGPELAPGAGGDSPPPRPAAAEAPRARDIDVLGNLLGGARLGQYTLVSPMLSGSLLLRVRSWELGVSAAWETGYYNGGANGAGRRDGAETTSLTFARRQRLHALTLLAGFRLGMAVRLHDRFASFGSPSPAGVGFLFLAPRLQGRAGPFVGFSLPRSALVRLRFELGVELAFPKQDHSTLPWSTWPFWAFALSVGMELGRS